MRNKFLFLDIDGVLNSYSKIKDAIEHNKGISSHKILVHPNGIDWVSVPLVEKVKKIIENNNLIVIGISTWFDSDESLEIISNLLGIHILDKTECTSGTRERALSVLDWLEKHDYSPESGDGFAILDDSNYYNYPFVKVEGRVGIQSKDLEKVILLIKQKIDLNDCRKAQLK